MPLSVADLRAAVEARFDEYPEPYRVRLHRALSWLARAERETADPDARYLFLWIAFNAAYAQDYGHRDRRDGEGGERGLAEVFFERVLAVDTGHRLHGCLQALYSGPVHRLVDNLYLFQPFWEAVRGLDPWQPQLSAQAEDTAVAWLRREPPRCFGGLRGARQRATEALLTRQTGLLLEVVFDRLYVLRCSLMHGGATWDSQVNRQSVQDGVLVLGELLPVLLQLLIEHPALDLGPLAFPVVRNPLQVERIIQRAEETARG